MYHWIAPTKRSFIWHLAVNYASRGYYRYVQGKIPPHKEPSRTDAKILAQYGVAMSKWARLRRRKAGEAGIQYLRHQRRFVIIATEQGEHRFLIEEASQVRDLRQEPLKMFGYSMACRRFGGKAHVSVRIEKRVFVRLKKAMVRRAGRHSVEELVRDFRSLRVLPFMPVLKQMFALLKAVNRRRKLAGLEQVPPGAALPQRLERLETPKSDPSFIDRASFGPEF